MTEETNKHFALILLAALMIVCILPFSASAQIVNWSTNGSSALSQKDQMFMVNEFENVFFNISVTEMSDYKWYVNKVLTKSDNLNYLSSNYTFSVPLKNNLDISDNIWEISVISINGSEEHYHEWVITVLNQSEAPEIFDFFSDKKYKTRTDNNPWENTLPEWIEASNNNKDFDTTNGFLYLNRTATSQISSIYTNSTMKYGTWVFFERANATGVLKPQISRTVTVLKNETLGGYGHYHSFDGHNYFDAPLGDGSVKTTLYEYMSQAGVGEAYAETPVWDDSSWNEFKIIHEQDGNWYLFKNDIFVEQSYEKSDLINPDRIAIIEGINVANDDPAVGEWFEIDMLQAYEDEYLFPEQNIAYGNYILDLWSGFKGPYYFDAIRIVGRDITLADINNSINNQSLFEYDEETKTATSHTSIYLESGSSMLIENSVLYMNTSTGIKIFNVRNGAELVINNSRIDTTSDTLFRWQFPSSLDAIITDYGLIKKFNGIIEIRNSIINNTAYFNIHSGDRTIIKDSIISNVSTYNQHGNSIYSMSFINWFKTENFTFNNITITSKTDEIDLKFIDGDAFGETNIYNSDLSNCNLYIASKTADISRAEPHTRSINLINTLYSNVTQTSNTYLTPWYYLDIYVKNLTGNPVSNAEIQISNSVGNKNPRNLYEYTKWTSSLDEGYSHHDIGFLKWETTDISNTVTTSDGHSPLPPNKMSAVILPDYKQYKDNEAIYQTNYTYNATITTINGFIILSEIASGPWWYRPNPEIPTYTIVVVAPNKSTTMPSIVGYAPSMDNTITPGKTIMFQTWTNHPMVANTWKLDGITVETASQSWLWENIPEGEHTVVYEGSNANGAVSQRWDINGGISGVVLAITESFPVATSPVQNNGSTYEFNVTVNQPLASSEWYLDGSSIDSDTLSMDHTWTHASTHIITFMGSNANGSVSKTWTVEVSDAPQSSIAITTATQTVAPDQQITLTVPITPATPIAGAQFDLLYDGTMATVTSVTEGNLFNQDGASTFFSSGGIDNVAGKVTNVYGSILGATMSSQGSMATISMTAGSTTGYLDINLSNVRISEFSGNNSTYVSYTLTNATILIDTAPVLSSIGAKSVDEKSVLAFTLDASDADGDSLTYTTTNLPAGASFNTATGAFSWTPADGEAGTYVVTFEVTDGYISDSEAVTITVNDGNNAPVITTFVPANSLIFNELDVITVGIIASDADGDALTYNIKIDGVTKSTSSNYVWETDYSSAGTHTIDITVSDGIEQVTDSRTITINDVRPRWDVNEDGTVDVLDISMIGQKYGTSVGAPYPRWDVNQDGGINVQDMTLTGSHFGETVA